MKYDFGGYATKVDLRCSDGRTIRRGAFKDDDGRSVPLVWNHQRNDPENILGNALLEHRDDGVYAYCKFNENPKSVIAKSLVEHGDIRSLSIHANQLMQKGADVLHGVIREVSLVLAGANPGASIDNLAIEHSDGTVTFVEEEAIIYFDDPISLEVEHSDEEVDHAETEEGAEKKIKEIFDGMTPDQKSVCYAMVGYALSQSADEDGEEDNESADQSYEDDDEEVIDHSNEGGNEMHNNVFESQVETTTVLTHADTEKIFANAKKFGSLKDAVNEYLGELNHGITDIETLFPEAKAFQPTPEMIMRNQDWVPKVWNATRKSPFSRIKSVFADLTKDEARARGYIKGKKKIEEQFGLLKRVTTPQTVYKKQKLDRDDIIDITDFDVVAWLKAEMRMMLNEELARAILIGDGREVGAEDHISHDHVRPIYTDAEMYSIHRVVDMASAKTNLEKADAILDTLYRAMDDYQGSGSLSAFMPSDVVTTMLLARDLTGRRLYNTVGELATALRVKEIVEVPVLKGQTRTTEASDNPDGYENATKYDLLGIFVNLSDYNVGADRGGAVTMFDDFDIDYNQYKYLIETRFSGALIRPYSAIVLEAKHQGE